MLLTPLIEMNSQKQNLKENCRKGIKVETAIQKITFLWIHHCYNSRKSGKTKWNFQVDKNLEFFVGV